MALSEARTYPLGLEHAAVCSFGGTGADFVDPSEQRRVLDVDGADEGEEGRLVFDGVEERFHAPVPDSVDAAEEDRGGAFIPEAGDEGGGEEGGGVVGVVRQDRGEGFGWEEDVDGRGGGLGGLCVQRGVSNVTYPWYLDEELA